MKAILDAGGIGRSLHFAPIGASICRAGIPGRTTARIFRQGRPGRRRVNTLCHPLDYLRWLFGEVRSVFAVTDRVSDLEIDVEDLAEITLRFENGVIGSVHLDFFNSRRRTGWRSAALQV